MADIKVKVELNEPKIRNKVTSDRFGLFVAKEWKRLINPFTPHRDGNLERNVQYKPFQIKYISPYSHYQYNGKVYVDPLCDVGGFSNDGGISWFSRPGIKKKPSGRALNYLKDHNPKATDHWDVAAARAGQKDKLYRTINNALQSGKY